VYVRRVVIKRPDHERDAVDDADRRHSALHAAFVVSLAEARPLPWTARDLGRAPDLKWCGWFALYFEFHDPPELPQSPDVLLSAERCGHARQVGGRGDERPEPIAEVLACRRATQVGKAIRDAGRRGDQLQLPRSRRQLDYIVASQRDLFGGSPPATSRTRVELETSSQAGHAPTMTLDTYAHLFDELQGRESVSAEALIREARDHFMSPEVSVLCPRGDDPNSTRTENPCKTPKPTPGLEPGTPSLRVKCSTS
jgi:hypothetical protein